MTKKTTIDTDKIAAACSAAASGEVTCKLVAERRGKGSPGGTLPNGKPDPMDPPDDGLLQAAHLYVDEVGTPRHHTIDLSVGGVDRTADEVEQLAVASCTPTA